MRDGVWRLSALALAPALTSLCLTGCSGSDPPSASTCLDGMRNGVESDVDCGGGFCPACVEGHVCKQALDCISSVCLNNLCVAAVDGGVSFDAACLPNCEGSCGGVDDGCGGTCDDCPSGYICQYTTCMQCGEPDEPCCPGEVCSGGNLCKAERCVVTICTNFPDFTPCDVVTSPDRSYDICVDQSCVSPGCGDITCNTPGPHFTLSDTNQRLCYSDGNPAGVIGCPSSGGAPCNAAGEPALCGQDAQYGWDVFFSPPSARFDVGWPSSERVVTDTVTGLIWQGCAAGWTGSDCSTGSSTTRSWSEALAYCDALAWGGETDWRLPDRFELQSIVNYGHASPAIEESAFPPTWQDTDYFWSSSSASVSAHAWWIYFGVGYVHDFDTSASAANVRCVRSPASARLRFIAGVPVPGEPVVADIINDLAWQGCGAGQAGNGSSCTGVADVKTWSGALSYCESLSWGGETDWRLPNVLELSSLIDDRHQPAAIDPAFPGTPTDHRWLTSSSYAGSPTDNWLIDFGTARVDRDAKALAGYVRCVRYADP